MNEIKSTSPSTVSRREGVEHTYDAADRVSQAAGTLDRAAASVESNVTSGIQPDVRELRLLTADLRDTVAVAFRRIFWAVIIGIALNIVVLLAVFTR